MTALKKKLDHEEFYVEQERKLQLRQDRHVVSDTKKNVQLFWNNHSYKVFNFSYFGVCFFSEAPMESNTTLESSCFHYENSKFEDYNFQVKRCEPYESGYRVACECLDKPLPIEYIVKDQEINEVLVNMIQKINKYDEIKSEFKAAIGDIKYRMSVVKEELDEYDQKVFWSKKDKEFFETNVTEKVTNYLKQFIVPCADLLSKFSANLTKEELPKYYDFFREELKEFLYDAPFANRSYYKPLGYAGDYEMMNIIYRNEVIGNSLFSKSIHKFLVEHSNAKAVRNRGEYLNNFLLNKFNNSKEKFKVLAVASGPAREVQMLVNKLDQEQLDRLEIHMLDQDIFSLKYAQAEVTKLLKQEKKNLKLFYHNKAIKQVINDGLDEKYDLIYSAGLFDYFSDPVAKAAATQLYHGLNDNGELNIGNFCFNSNSVALMMYILDWFLIYRSEDELTKLYSNVANEFHVESEPEGVNLFAVFKK